MKLKKKKRKDIRAVYDRIHGGLRRPNVAVEEAAASYEW